MKDREHSSLLQQEKTTHESIASTARSYSKRKPPMKDREHSSLLQQEKTTEALPIMKDREHSSLLQQELPDELS